MTAFMDRLRKLPRHWLAIGGTSVAVFALLFAVIAAGGDGTPQVAIADLGTPTAPSTASPGDEPLPTEGPGTTASSSATTMPTSPVTPPHTSAVTLPITSTATSSTIATPPATIDIDSDYELDIDADVPAVEGRPVPEEPPPEEPPPTTIAPPPWAATTRLTEGGHIATDVGCADDVSAESLDRFFAERVGPVLGWDYQHVYPLGGDRYLWLFQDAFVDHSGTKSTLGSARFVHNAALVQDDRCFSLLHRGSTERPAPFEEGDGSVDIRSKWLWPMGGELVDGRLWVFWAEMVKDPYDPDPPNGLGWHPQRLFLATYDADTLERVDYQLPRNNGVAPIYGYAVASDESHTYLFGNTFEQNMLREGGFWNGPHSATRMYLARVPLGKLAEWPQYRTADGWSYAPEDAVPIVERFYAENPMQPRYLDGQWVAATAVDGYWGDSLAIDVADDPWGPWATVQYSDLEPRNADPKMNTYHAQPLPWRDRYGSVQITVSNNARNMLRDAWPHPHRYRPAVMFTPYTATPPTTTTSTTSTTTSTTTTSSTTPTITTTTLVPTTTTSTTTSTTLVPTTTTSTTTSTTLVPTTTTSTSSTTTTTTSTTTTTAPTTTAPTSTTTTTSVVPTTEP